MKHAPNIYTISVQDAATQLGICTRALRQRIRVLTECGEDLSPYVRRFGRRVFLSTSVFDSPLALRFRRK